MASPEIIADWKKHEVHFGPKKMLPRYHEDFNDDGIIDLAVFNRTTLFYDSTTDRLLTVYGGYCEVEVNRHRCPELGPGDSQVIPAETAYRIHRIIEKIGPCVVRETRITNEIAPDLVFTEPTTV